MDINNTNRMQEFDKCSSFEELSFLIDKYYYLHALFTDKILERVNSLPIEFNEHFIKCILNIIQSSNEASSYINILKVYSNRVVNEGLLKEVGNESSFIPVIIYSATEHSKIHIHYLNYYIGMSVKRCEEVFYNHNYDIDPGCVTDRHIIDILTSNIAYEDWLHNWIYKMCHNEQIMYLVKRSDYIAQKTKACDSGEIYDKLIYLIGTLDLINDSKSFEDNLRMIYDTIDMILMYIDIPAKESIKDKIKDDLVNMLINEAFLFKSTFGTKLERYHENCKVQDGKVVRMIPDYPTLLHAKDDSQITTEAFDKNSSKMDKASRKIYSGYKAYKDAENKVDSQLTKLAIGLKDAYTGNKSARDRVIEGKQFSVVKILKKIFTTAAIFSYSKIAGILFVITKHFCSKKVDNKARKEVISEIELEIKMLDEKIDDARGDGNRQAKYSMMRTRAELQKALEKIKYGLEADKKALNTAKQVVSGAKSLDYDKPQNEEE